MSEYWKSNAKKYCEYCKTWISDNKSSIAIHEGGKTHKEKVAEKLKSIRKRNDQKTAEEKKFNSEMAAIERAAMAAMEKDLKSNPCLKNQYGSIAKNQSSLIHQIDEIPEKKLVKKEKTKAPKVEVSGKRKLEEAEKPEQQSRIGKWQTIESSRVIEKPIVYENVDLQLPSSSGRTSKFEAMSVEQLQFELQKADHEFRNKVNYTQTVKETKISESVSQESEDTKQSIRHHNNNTENKSSESKWKPVSANSGFVKVKEESIDLYENSEYLQPSIKEPSINDENIQVKQEELLPKEIIKKELVEEKIVSLNSSSKKHKVVGFKKRKTDSAHQNLRERRTDD